MEPLYHEVYLGHINKIARYPSMKTDPKDLPDLPFAEWTDTRKTLHLILQIIGKAKLKMTTRKNHWWYITIHVTPRGFSTLAIPSASGLHSFEIEVDVRRKAVVISRSDADEVLIPLEPGFSVAAFHARFMGILASMGQKPVFIPKPLDMGIDKPFSELTEYLHYDWSAIERFWAMMRWNASVFQEFSGRYYGKTCPVHIYWHSLDLTVTRFSGKKLPAPKEKTGRLLERDTYSHEQISFGFWAGDDKTPEPMYYSYTFPSPEGIDQEPLAPNAQWIEANGSSMAVMRYADVRASEDPRKSVLDFMESAYQAGAKRAKWDLTDTEVPPLTAV